MEPHGAIGGSSSRLGQASCGANIWEILSFPQEPVPGPPACPSHQPHRKPLIWSRKKLLSEPRHLQLLGRPVLPVSLLRQQQRGGGGSGGRGGCCSLLDAAHCSLNVAWPLQGPLQPEGTDCLLFRVSLTSRSRLGIELGLQTAEPLSKAWHSAPPGRGEQAGVRLDPQELSKAERQRKQWAGSRTWCGHRPLCTVKGCPSGPSNRPECQSKPVTL